LSISEVSIDYFDFSAGARALKVGGSNLKIGGPNFFIDFIPEKACRA